MLKKSFFILTAIFSIFTFSFYLAHEKKSGEKGNSEIVHPELGTIKLPESFPPSSISPAPATYQQNPSIDNSELPEEIRKLAMKDIEHGGRVNNLSQNSAGFSDEGSQKISQGGAIPVNDMPKELQATILENLSEIKKNGYELVSDSEISDITEIENNVVDSSEAIKNISFKPSTIPESLSSDYTYVGYSFDKTSFNQSSDGVSDSVRRIYKSSDSSNTLIVEERSLANGSSNPVAEFINGSVGDSPAIYSVKKSNNGKSYSMLSWSGKNYSYSLYLYGNSSEDPKKKLTNIGEKINKANNK